MKELSLEAKAKAYDKAIAKSVEFLSLCKKCGAKDTVDFLESIFPELKGSEDEKIRKELTEFLKSASGGFLDTTTQCKTFGKWVAWLEKQGKNKGNNKLIWKHWSNGIAGNGDGEPIYLIKTGNTYSLSSCLGFECDYIELSELDNLMLEKQGEQKPAWSEEDENKPNGGIVMEEFNDGNGFYKVNLAYLNEEHVEEIEELVKRWGLQPKRDEDESIISDLLDYFDEDKCLKHEVNDIIKWLKTIKPQQKGWGENEIKMLDNLIAYLDGRKDLLEEIKETYIDWLKSLKDRVQPQSQWKPSEEQIIALEYIINNARNTSYSCKIAKELLEQLKKLKV